MPRRLFFLAWPISLLNLLSYVSGIIPLGFVGHLDPFSLSVAVLGNSLFNVTGLNRLPGNAGCTMLG